MNVDSRVLVLGAAAIGAGAFGASLQGGRNGDGGAPNTLPALVGIAAGAVALGGGIGMARLAESTLRPGFAQAGRALAAAGGAAIVGSATGLIGAYAVSRRTTHQLVDEQARVRDAAQARIDELPEPGAAAAKLDEEAAGLAALEAEAEPVEVELQVDDGRIDLVGAPVAAVALTLFNHYVASRDHGLSYRDGQRTDDEGRSFSIMPLLEDLLDIRTQDEDDLLGVTATTVEARLRTLVDTDESGIIEAAEARAWYDGLGEVDVTWDWPGLLEEIGPNRHVDSEHRALSIGAWDDSTPLLAMPGYDDLDDVAEVARAIARRTSLGAVAVVELPADAPTRYALATVLHDGNQKYGAHADAWDVSSDFHPSVVRITDGATDIALDAPRVSTNVDAPDDWRVPIGGASMAGIAEQLLDRYDRNDSGIWIGEAQYADPATGRVSSIIPLLDHSTEVRFGTDDPDDARLATVDGVIDAMEASVARSSGDPELLDGAEPATWYASGGEVDVTWDWAALLEDLNDTGDAEPKAVRLARVQSEGDDRGENPMVALPGVDSLDRALEFATAVARSTSGMAAVVRLPADAPATYAIASATLDGDYDTPDDVLAQLAGAETPALDMLDDRVVGLADATDTVSR